jgi:hypothetical protein
MEIKEILQSLSIVSVLEHYGIKPNRNKMVCCPFHEEKTPSMQVYEASPVIKLEDGTELVKTNNIGKSTFFPDSWDETRILDEVEYAIANNHGKLSPSKPNDSTHFGYSRDGRVEIHFIYSNNDQILTYYPIKK